MNETEDAREDMARKGLYPVITEEAERYAYRNNLPYDILFEQKYPIGPEEILDVEEGDNFLGVAPSPKLPGDSNIELDEVFPRSQYRAQEESPPYEVDEKPLFNQNEPYDDLLE